MRDVELAALLHQDRLGGVVLRLRAAALPALVERRVGTGRVLVWGSTLDTYWNDLPLQPVFLPFVHRPLSRYVNAMAANGLLAQAKIDQLKPDAVTMDIEMPQMNGIEAVRELRKRHKHLPVIMFSAVTERGARTTIEALTSGANDYLCKVGSAEGGVSNAVERVRSEQDRPAPYPPAMDEGRRINAQDCTQPIDESAGNLRCR